MAQDRRLGHDFRSGVQGLRRRPANGRLLIDPGASACRERQKGGSQNADVAASGDLLATRCMGRSRGGLTTKIHAVVDANGNPIALKLSEKAHDGRSAADMLDSVGPGQTLLADRAYDSDALRQTLADRGAWANARQCPGFQPLPLSLAQSRRALLQQAQTFQGDRHALRKTRRQISRTRQTRRRENLDALYESVT